MRSSHLWPSRAWSACVCAVLVLLPAALSAQPSATLQGRVFDASDAVIHDAVVSVQSLSTGLVQSVRTDRDGRYYIPAITAGAYAVTATAAGFRAEQIEVLTVEVGRTLVRDFRLAIGDRTETVVVAAELQLIDRASATVGHVVTPATVREMPLNGRHFADLSLLVPGSVAPSQTGFSTPPGRGDGPLAINTAGNREEAVAFVVNGVSSNNLTFGSLMFQPPIASLAEFKVDNSAFSAEYGHVSGAIVNIVTRSGSDRFGGEAFESFRDDVLDARNFFEFTSPEPHPFSRNQFGASIGGPAVRQKLFFFATYEGLRQRQGVDMNSLVLSDAERGAATHPVVQRLIERIPRANVVDASGTSRFVGAADAVANNDRWTVDVRYKLTANDQLHVFTGSQRIRWFEPASNGNTIPGFGHVGIRDPGTLTVGATHVFKRPWLNEARFGRSWVLGVRTPGAELSPADFGIRNGITRSLGLPQFVVAGGLNFGGPANYPLGRDDTSYVFTDALSYFRGRHSMKFGGEYRHFLNENFEETTGSFNFPTVASFLSGNANAFTTILGERRSHIDQRAVGLFAQDRVSIRSDLTLELGLRYEWHVTPTERDNQFVVFDPGTVSLRRVGVDVAAIHRQNNRNLEPRLGIVWSPSGANTVVRGAYGWAVDEPGTTAVRSTAANPPFALPLAATGSIPITDPIAATRPTGIAPATVDPDFRNASVRSWNVNVQRQVSRRVAATIGYMGSRGKNLRLSRNLNQPVNGIRPFPALSASSPILPGSALGNITQVESSGFSRYHSLWLSFTKRLSRGLQFETSYTWSRSLDTNSLNSSGFAVQDSYDIPNQYGRSDYDAPHRFVLSAVYDLPFSGHAVTRGWQIAAIVQAQSGNPVNIVTSNSVLNGAPNTVRPDLVAPIRVIGSADRWFDPAAFVAVNRFGNLARNAVRGPGFRNTDLSVAKTAGLPGPLRLQMRVDVFDLFNHANFGPPGNIVGTPNFGKITRTRFPTGEAGSSRQIQLAARVMF